jgi:hypothetical protein
MVLLGIPSITRENTPAESITMSCMVQMQRLLTSTASDCTTLRAAQKCNGQRQCTNLLPGANASMPADRAYAATSLQSASPPLSTTALVGAR